jgi:hypothetical protein
MRCEFSGSIKKGGRQRVNAPARSARRDQQTMATIQRKRAPGKRKHHPELLRAKRAARALNVPWEAVTRERDRLRQNELDKRGHLDEARQAAWGSFIALNRWSASQAAWWRNGFQRVFRKRIARGSDFTIIPRYDEIADSVRESCPEFSGHDEAAIWEFLLSDYEERKPIWEHYEHAILRCAAAMLPVSDDAPDLSDMETPF